MTVSLPKFRVGDPLRCEALSVFPIFTAPTEPIEYRLANEALADQSLLVEEVSEGGSVPNLRVENKGSARVLFLEGEELVGAKQNRILNTSVLVAAYTKLNIPVSCVERGRWGYKSRYFGASGSHSPMKLRRTLKKSVSDSVQMSRGHSSDQAAVWREVDGLHASHGVESGTSAMSDAFDTHRDRIAAFKERLQYVAGATGVAIAIGGKVTAVDVFDKPATCEKVWERLLSGVVFDALEAGAIEQVAAIADVERLLNTAGELPWQRAEAVGEGEEYRAESSQGDHASALIFAGAVIHESLVAAE